MAKQIYVDENGNPIEVSGTINTAELLPISGNDPTDTKSYIDNIVTSGTNANGYYIKYADGSMICTKTASVEVLNTAWSDWGSLKEATSLSLGDFAETFYQAPNVSLTLSGDAAWLERISGTTVSSVGTISILRPNSPGRTTNYNVSVTAIGRWKA